ncbi:MAG: hypothetical protein U9O24_03610 [Campylobacterota bacterium]|nr:hypothetical protein [Campylobacterota bacterium]
MKLLKAMFDTSILLKIIVNIVIVTAIVGLYILGLYLLLTVIITGNLAFLQILSSLTILMYVWYGMIIFLPFLLFLKFTKESRYYILPLAKAYGVKLSIIKNIEKDKEKDEIKFYIFAAILFAVTIITLFVKTDPYFLPIAFIPLYILIYKNWMNGLSLALGEAFRLSYEKNKSPYIMRGFFFIFLMHIPIVWFFQPWMLQALADVFFKQQAEESAIDKMKSKNV